jgi:hypothetical protein
MSPDFLFNQFEPKNNSIICNFATNFFSVP